MLGLAVTAGGRTRQRYSGAVEFSWQRFRLTFRLKETRVSYIQGHGFRDASRIPDAIRERRRHREGAAGQ